MLHIDASYPCCCVGFPAQLIFEEVLSAAIMKTPYYSGAFTVAQHTVDQDAAQIRERMLEHRLANRDDVREIYIVTALPFSNSLRKWSIANSAVNQASKKSETDLSWAMHWALQIGDQFFELQRGYPDPLRTGLQMGEWDEQKRSQIRQRYRQGTTAMTDLDIKAVGERYFSRLNRIDINTYDLWCNNCHNAVDSMLRDIGGLSYYRTKLDSLHDMVRQWFYDAILSVMTMYGRYRGWNEEVITKYTGVLHKTLRVMTARSKYPKRHWIRSDIEKAESNLQKFNAVKDHWFLSILESALSLRKGSEELYVQRGADGKPQLNYKALKEATKGIFDDDEKSWRLSWIKAVPWLTAGFLVGTPRWAAAVISIALARASELYKDHKTGIVKGSLEESLTSLGMSPNPQNSPSISSVRPKLQNQRKVTTGPRRVRPKTLSIDNRLVARYERYLTAAGVPYFIDHMNKTQSWDAPDQQELCLKITDPPLSRKWEEKQEDGRTFYVNRLTGELTDVRPGVAEIWAVKKRVKHDWIKSTTMALPHGWEMRRKDEGEMYYINHNECPPTSTEIHPMRQEIEAERRKLLPEWNVEWDNDRGKKYRSIQTGEIRWKAVDGPQYKPVDENARITLRNDSQGGFIEPLPPGWTMVIAENGQKIYKNGKTGKERIERITHPLTDKRRRLQPEWEMRYNPAHLRYWIHHGDDGRGTSWWRRNRILKNTSLKNNASGWKLADNGLDWEWFEGGDVKHSEIPVLDLDDPMDREFREYPFILPPRIIAEDGSFLEPLPPDWVRREDEDGSGYYWNFKDEIRSIQHPYEEVRINLPALWSMRYTRHGRQYFIHYEDGSTWWTHPRENKHTQNQRARPGQRQDGWRLEEDCKTWQRFEERPDAQTTEETMHTLSPQSTESESLQDERRPLTWRSISSTRDWLKSANSLDVLKRVGSSDVVTNARTRFPPAPKLLKKMSTRSAGNSLDSSESPEEAQEDDELIEETWIEDTPAITEEPQSSEELDQEEATSLPLQDFTNQIPVLKASPDITSSLVHSPLDSLIEEPKSEELSGGTTRILEGPMTEEPMVEKASTKAESTLRSESEEDMTAMSVAENQLIEQSITTTSPFEMTPKELTSAQEPEASPESATAGPLHKNSKKGWAKRTTSGLLALKKNMEKRNAEGGFTLPRGVKVAFEKATQPAVNGLGISGAEPVDPCVEAKVTSLVEGEACIEAGGEKVRHDIAEDIGGKEDTRST